MPDADLVGEASEQRLQIGDLITFDGEVAPDLVLGTGGAVEVAHGWDRSRSGSASLLMRSDLHCASSGRFRPRAVIQTVTLGCTGNMCLPTGWRAWSPTRAPFRPRPRCLHDKPCRIVGAHGNAAAGVFRAHPAGGERGLGLPAIHDRPLDAGHRMPSRAGEPPRPADGASRLVLKNDRSYEWRKSREGADDPERRA